MMQIEKKLRACVVGATGMVGQRFITLLEDHPFFCVTKLAASQKANTEGKLKYSINFVAMYAGTLPNGNRHFVTYKIYMTVAQQGSSWQMEEMAISNY